MSFIKTIIHRCKVWLRNLQNTNRLLSPSPTKEASIYTQEPRYMSLKDNIRSMVISLSLLLVGALVIANVDYLSFLYWQGWWGAIVGQMVLATIKLIINLVVLVERVTGDRYSRRASGFQVELYLMLSEITEAFGLQPTRKVNILYHTLNRKLFTTTVAEDWHWFAQMIDSAFSPRPTPGLITMNGRKVSATFGAVVPSIFGTVEFDPDLIEWKNNVLAPGRLIDLADVLAEGEDIETNVSKCEKTVQAHG
jgi:hypothetical protein